MTLSLELSRRLDELKVKVESEHVWVQFEEPRGWELWLKWDLEHDVHHRDNKFISAPTSEELWAVMPVKIPSKMIERDYHLGLDKGEERACARYGYYAGHDTLIMKFHKSPTEALGLLAIWLAENGHLKGE